MAVLEGLFLIMLMNYSAADTDMMPSDTVMLANKDEDLSYGINAKIIHNCTTILETSFPGKSVYATFGNQDYWPNNQFPPYNNDLYNDTWKMWGRWIGDTSQVQNFRKGAYYTVKVQPKIRLIALNTNLYYVRNDAVPNVTDPGDKLMWLNQTLHKSEINHDKVVITAHIPPGFTTPHGELSMYTVYHDPLVSILKQYAHIIVGMHFGHDQKNQFKILSNKMGQPAAPIFLSPSVTPFRAGDITTTYKPAVRLVLYDRLSGKHLKIQQYYLDIGVANRVGTDDWKLEYSTWGDHGLSDLTAKSLSTLSKKMETANSPEYLTYKKFNYLMDSSNPVAFGTSHRCTECHAHHLCAITEFSQAAFNLCIKKLTPSAAMPKTMSLIGVIISLLSCVYGSPFRLV